MVMVLPAQMHSILVHSPSGLSTSSLPRVSRISLKKGSCLFHHSCPLGKDRFCPAGDQRGRLSGPRATSLVTVALMGSPLASLPRMTMMSPTQPCAPWHSIDVIHLPPTPPSGPTACSSTPELRTYLPPSVRLPHLYSTLR